MIIPTIYNVRLDLQAWSWTWVLAANSTVCTVVAIPLELRSHIVAIFFAVAQTFVKWQLGFALQAGYHRTERREPRKGKAVVLVQVK